MTEIEKELSKPGGEELKSFLGNVTVIGCSFKNDEVIVNCRLCMKGVKCGCSLFPCTSYTRRMLEISQKLEG